VVDSDDLPLNVGREILQKSRMLTVINKALVKKSLQMVKDISINEKVSERAKERAEINWLQPPNIRY
jgi:heat shock protein beta